ncbi:hypothetical protein [Halopiger thermotolerans]
MTGLTAAGVHSSPIGNKHAVPGETPPTVTSRIRVGIPALATRGLEEAEMEAETETVTRQSQVRSNRF